jgi:hypothetical protein
MVFLDSAREGFRTVHRNWQLVLIRIIASVINWVAFFVMVVIPVVLLVVTVGMELASATDVWSFLNSLTAALFKVYFAVALLIISSFLLYLVFASVVWLFALSGSMGVLAKRLAGPAATDINLYLKSEEKFSLREFFSEGRRLFFPLMRFYIIIGFAIIGAFFIVGLALGGAFYITDLLRETNMILAALLGTVLVLFAVALWLFSTFGVFALSVYGACIVATEDGRATSAIRKAYNFLVAHPRGFWGYVLMLLGYMVVFFLLVAIGYPFKLIPIIGSLIMLPYQLAAYAVERYLGLGIIGSVFAYYLNNRGRGTREGVPPEIQTPPAAEGPAGPPDGLASPPTESEPPASGSEDPGPDTPAAGSPPQTPG